MNTSSQNLERFTIHSPNLDPSLRFVEPEEVPMLENPLVIASLIGAVVIGIVIPGAWQTLWSVLYTMWRPFFWIFGC